MMNKNQPPTDDLSLAVQIMAGLLASGHFTEINPENDGGAATRYAPAEGARLRVDAADEAVCLLDELKLRLGIESPFESGDLDRIEREYLTPKADCEKE